LYARAAATLSLRCSPPRAAALAAGTLRGIGVQTFSEPLFVGGPTVLDNDDIWRVAELHMDETPPVAVVERAEA
jgi:hypothetical protein